MITEAPNWSMLGRFLDRRLRGRPRYDVAFYLPSTAKVLVDRPGTLPPGGAETQIALLMRSLAKRGHRVALIAFDVPGGLPPTVDGIDIFVRRPYAGRLGRRVGFLRKLHGAITEALTVLGIGLLFPSRVIVQRTAGVNTGLVAIGCVLARKRFVWSSANDFDFEFHNFLKSPKQFRLYRFGVEHASQIVVQTEVQAGLCRKAFGRTPVTIPSLAEVVPPDPEIESGQQGPILWVGRVIDYKGPLEFLELARINPDLQFMMVAVPEHGDARALYEEVRSSAMDLPNLELREPLNRSSLLAVTSTAMAIANTSTHEGMPNVFLEGWSRGVPSVSLNVDPDGVIARFGLGVSANGDMEVLSSGTRRLVEDSEFRNEVSRHCREYIRSAHSPAVVSEAWESALGLTAVRQAPPAERKMVQEVG